MTKKTKYGIFTKPIHVEKLTKILEKEKLNYFVSVSDEEVYKKDFNIGVSYCFPRIIDLSNFSQRVRWFNYHPAPLPKYKGLNCYEEAISDQVTEYAATLHLMVQEVDSGPIIDEERFELRNLPVDVNELGNITHYYLFQLFRRTIKKLEIYAEEFKDFDVLN